MAASDVIELYQGRNGHWFFRVRARNGRIVGDGSEGYTRKHDAKRAIAKRYPDADIRELENA